MTKVVKLDDLVGRMVERDEPCWHCGETHDAVIHENRVGQLDARCVECNRVVRVLQPDEIFSLVHELRALRAQCSRDGAAA